MSMRMRSGRCLRANSTASIPLRVCTMRCPRVSTRSLKSFMLSSLSSTMSTVLGMGLSMGANLVGSPANANVETFTNGESDNASSVNAPCDEYAVIHKPRFQPIARDLGADFPGGGLRPAREVPVGHGAGTTQSAKGGGRPWLLH